MPGGVPGGGLGGFGFAPGGFPGGVLGGLGFVPGGVVPGGAVGEPGLVPGGFPGLPGAPGLVGGEPGVVPGEPGVDCANARLAPAMPSARAAIAIGLIIGSPFWVALCTSRLRAAGVTGCRRALLFAVGRYSVCARRTVGRLELWISLDNVHVFEAASGKAAIYRRSPASLVRTAQMRPGPQPSLSDRFGA
jgi:hypothetical protein